VLPYTRFCVCRLDYDYVLHHVNFMILYVSQQVVSVGHAIFIYYLFIITLIFQNKTKSKKRVQNVHHIRSLLVKCSCIVKECIYCTQVLNGHRCQHCMQDNESLTLDLLVQIEVYCVLFTRKYYKFINYMDKDPTTKTFHWL
jgi:hypothetical protein